MFSTLLSQSIKQRQSNFELLRIIAMLLVLIVHADFWSLGQPSYEDLVGNPANGFTRVLFECISIVCVNVFVMISGWFGIKPSWKGLLGFIFQCAYFFILIFIFLFILGIINFSLRNVASLFALTKFDWFIKAYIGLYILSPILNSFIKGATKRSLEIFLISFYLFQTIYGWSETAYFITRGYSTFSFIGLYILARYLKLYKHNIYQYGFNLYLISILINILLYFVLSKYSLQKFVTSYVNPFVVIGSAGMIMTTARLRFRPSKIINFIAKSSFAVYLLHQNPNTGDQIYKPIITFIYNNNSGIECMMILFFVIITTFILAIIWDQPRIIIWEYLTLFYENYKKKKIDIQNSMTL